MSEHNGHKTQAHQIPCEDDKPQAFLATSPQPDRQHDARDSFQNIKVPSVICHLNRQQLSGGQRCEKEFNRNEAAAEVEKEMYAAAEKLDFERAAELRDTLRQLTGDMAPAMTGPPRKAKPPQPKITYKVSEKKYGMPKGFNK